MNSGIVKLNEIIIDHAEKSGAQQVEAFTIDVKMINAYVEGGKMNVITNNEWIGIGIRTVIDKRVSFVSGIYNKEEDIENLIRTGIKLAKLSPKDEKFKSLPEPRQITGNIEDVYDEELEYLEPSTLWEYSNEIIMNAEKNGVRVMNGLIRVNIFKFNVMNSLGVDFSHKGTTVFIHFSAKKDTGEGVIKKYATSLKEIAWDAIGKELLDKTLISARARPYHGKSELEVIIDPMELQGLLRGALQAANGENINRKRSPWIGKLNQKIASEDLTIIDDGRMRGGLRSALADDEGVPTTSKPIIEKGILKNYYYDHYNAGIANTEPTGNGFRRGISSIENAHTTIPRCTLSNVKVLPSNKSLDDLVTEVDKGVIIKKFAYPEVDFITGNFGLEVRSAVLVENGSIGDSIKHALLVGNIYEALNNISGIGRELFKVENFVLPYIRFRGIQLVGL